ncbi:unnamed protein product, partial [Prorocentrum cordatum]
MAAAGAEVPGCLWCLPRPLAGGGRPAARAGRRWGQPLPDGGAGGARACLQGLSASELEVVAEAASILAGVHVARVEDLSALHREAMRVLRLEHPAGCGDASPLSPSSRLARAAEILPDLVQ